MAIDKSIPILIVDDYRTMRRIVRNLLSQLGFDDIEEAEDGVGALARLEQRRFGLVISDWNMEPMDGLQLLAEVRARPDMRHLRFIMVSAYGHAERVAAAEAAGADGYIVKPFDADDLDHQIVRVVGG
jgi:two-component system chemotaxis response regulator CheY